MERFLLAGPRLEQTHQSLSLIQESRSLLGACCPEEDSYSRCGSKRAWKWLSACLTL